LLEEPLAGFDSALVEQGYRAAFLSLSLAAQ